MNLDSEPLSMSMFATQADYWKAEAKRLRAEVAAKEDRLKWFENAGGVALTTRFYQVEAERDRLREFIEALCGHIETYEPDGKRIAATIRTMRDKAALGGEGKDGNAA